MAESAVITVGEGPVVLLPSAKAYNDLDRVVTIRNVGTELLVLGDASLTMESGWELEPNGEITISLAGGRLLYGLTGDTTDVRLQTYGGDMIVSSAISVGTSATLLTTGVDENSEPDRSIALRNVGAVDVYLGGSDVSSANGWTLLPDGEISFDLTAGDLLYGIVTSGTCDVRVIQTGI